MTQDAHTHHYNSDEEQLFLLAILQRHYLLMLAAINALVAAEFDLDPAEFEVDDNTTRRLLLGAAARVVRIDTVTRLAVATMLAEGQHRGYSNWELAYGVPKDDFPGIDGLFKEKWKSRALTVARTELQSAQLAAALERYHASGLVDRVQIVDGCQWDAECCARNGKIVRLEQAPGLNHPNCTLMLIPLLREGITQPSPQQGEPAKQPALL